MWPFDHLIVRKKQRDDLAVTLATLHGCEFIEATGLHDEPGNAGYWIIYSGPTGDLMPQYSGPTGDLMPQIFWISGQPWQGKWFPTKAKAARFYCKVHKLRY